MCHLNYDGDIYSQNQRFSQKLYLKPTTDNPDKLFLETDCFATEKYDGTNIAKDDVGQIYSRRFAMEEGQEMFIKTSLKKVKEAKIDKFRTCLIEAAGLDPTVLRKCVVYGEFICNGFYDYSERGIRGDWIVFGAKLELKKEGTIDTIGKLAESGFAVPKHSNDPNHVKVLPNKKFFEVAKKANLDVPEVKGTNESLATMIAMNKDEMKRGTIEGLIITIYEEESGYRVVKWKGTQEFQPMAHENFLKANDLVQKSSAHEDVKKAFLDISEVITDTSQNELVIKMMKKTKSDPGKEKPEERKKGKYLTNLNKEIVLAGIYHSQKKFDSVEEYKKRGEKALEEYNGSMIEEVRKHLAEENSDFEEVDNDDSVMAFIRYKVKTVMKTQLADLESNLPKIAAN